MTRERVCNAYFNWLYDIVGANRKSKQLSYRKLLIHLHDTEFRYYIARDKNRARDGMDLRYRFALAHYHDTDPDYILDMLDGPCSVLEMMIALAIRCEDTMDDPSIGDRTGQWFWEMIVSLGLGGMLDSRYDARDVDDIVDRFLEREYEPDGTGGLFTIPNCHRDMRDAEIWNQMWWYIDSITDFSL